MASKASLSSLSKTAAAVSLSGRRVASSAASSIFCSSTSTSERKSFAWRYSRSSASSAAGSRSSSDCTCRQAAIAGSRCPSCFSYSSAMRADSPLRSSASPLSSTR